MANGVLTTKVNPVYDDLPEERYHFPKTYLRQIEKLVGEFIVYYEPRRIGSSDKIGGRQAYFATAQITELTSDPKSDGHYYAKIEHYIEFPRPVPFKSDAHFYESALQREDGATNKGAFGRSVREVPPNEFEAILSAGSALDAGSPDQHFTIPTDSRLAGFGEAATEFERPMIEQILQRPYRDVAFRKNICQAYNERCAITGLRLINGGGRAEVQAAHIQPVAKNGPDAIRNGIALCGTAHWMFDRGLISISDNYSILVADHATKGEAMRIINVEKRILLPDSPAFYPHPKFLDFHRREVFKGS